MCGLVLFSACGVAEVVGAFGHLEQDLWHEEWLSELPVLGVRVRA